MKIETARREIDSLDYYLQNHTDDYSEESHTAMMMAKKALEQEPVIDKIRAEIEEKIAKRPYFNFEKRERDRNDAFLEVLDIIDKYKAESEE